MDNIKNNQEPTLREVAETINDVLGAVNSFATNTEKRFNQVDERFDKVDERFDRVENRLDKVENRLDKVENRLDSIESTMVTKNHLDEKIADLRGDLVVMVRKEDTKFNTLISLMEKKQLLTPEEAGQFITMEPFARSAV